MPDRSVFTPITAQELEGPFTQAILPQGPRTPTYEESYGGSGKLATVATVGLNFLKGATQARTKAYLQNENEKIVKMNRLNSFVQNAMQNDTYSKDAKDLVQQEFSRAMGGEVLNNMPKSILSSVSKTQGRNEGSGEGPSSGNGVQHHAVNILKDIALGMVGGKLPKGAQNVDADAIIGRIYGQLYDDKGKLRPQFDKEAIITQNLTRIQQQLGNTPDVGTLTGPAKPKTAEEALQRITPQLQAVEGIDPHRAESIRKDVLSQYPSRPLPGSIEDIRSRALAMTEAGAPPTVTQGTAKSASVSAPTTTLTPQALSLYREAGWAKDQQIDYVGAGGKPQRMIAYEVTVPGQGIKWVGLDPSGQPAPLDPSKIRKAGVGEPNKSDVDSERFFAAYKDKHKIEGDLNAKQQLEAISEGKQSLVDPEIKADRESSRALRNATLEMTNERLREMREANSPEGIATEAQAVADGRMPMPRGEARQRKIIKSMAENNVPYNAPLNPQAQAVVRDTQPVLNSIRRLKAELEPYKNDDTPAALLLPRLAYAMGYGGNVGGFLSQLELTRIVGATRILKGSSRAVRPLEQAMIHTPDAWKDSKKLMYEKLGVVERNLTDVLGDAITYGNKYGVITAPPATSGGAIDLSKFDNRKK